MDYIEGKELVQGLSKPLKRKCPNEGFYHPLKRKALLALPIFADTTVEDDQYPPEQRKSISSIINQVDLPVYVQIQIRLKRCRRLRRATVLMNLMGESSDSELWIQMKLRFAAR